MDLDLNSTWTLDLDFGLGLTWTWIVTIHKNTIENAACCRDEIVTLFEEMDLESEGKLSFKQVMGGEESPLESLFRYEKMMSMMVSLETTLYRSMDKEGRGSISKDVNIISLNCCTDILDPISGHCMHG